MVRMVTGKTHDEVDQELIAKGKAAANDFDEKSAIKVHPKKKKQHPKGSNK